MRKIVILLFLLYGHLYALERKSTLKMYHSIFAALSQKTPVNVYTNDEEYRDVFKHSKNISLSDKLEEADIVLVTEERALNTILYRVNKDRDKKPIIFVTNYHFLKISNKIVGAFYWRKGRSQLLFIKSRLKEHNITSVCLVAAMIPFLSKLPPGSETKNHPLKKALCIPWNEEAKAFGRRYGIEVRTCFNMTEISNPMVSECYPSKIGTCGKIRDGVEARVVDENDCEVAPGVTGELILRTDRPWAMNHGYYKIPEATAAAWRNGWFHTGDGFKYDEEGYFYFVDRIKDAIRRRGENISSFEVENEVTAFDAVGEAAAIPVPSELGEDEVMIVVAPAQGKKIDPLELFNFLIPRMAHFMLPRYIRIIDDLPKTPTQKIKKHLLKDAGVTPDTWDREKEGIKVKRDKIGEKK